MENNYLKNKVTLIVEEQLIEIGLVCKNTTWESAEYFLKEKKRCNIRDVEAFLYRLGYGGDGESIACKLIPDGFFDKDYIKNEKSESLIERVMLLAIKLIKLEK